jgi:hypothetical protein
MIDKKYLLFKFTFSLHVSIITAKVLLLLASVTIAEFGYPVQVFWFFLLTKTIKLFGFPFFPPLIVYCEGFTRNASCALK